MAKIDITRTELVWPGKYNEDGTLNEVPKVNLPFQVIETVNESRATREVQKAGIQSSIFDIYEGKEGDTLEEGWRNKLIWGDNLLVMGSLLEKFAGKIDLIYIDPPFATGADFSFTTEVGESGEDITKGQSIIEEKAYRDTWGKGTDSFITMIRERLVVMRELLSDDGSIYVHLDWRMNSYVRILMDEVFGKDNFRNEIIVSKTRKNFIEGQRIRSFNTAFDSLLLYSKSFNTSFAPVYKAANRKERWHSLDAPNWSNSRPNLIYEIFGKLPPKGRCWAWTKEKVDAAIKEGRVRPNKKTGKPEYLIPASNQELVNNLWVDFNSYSFANGYPTEKNEALLERIIKASSIKGDLVADFFLGSGTTIAVAEKFGRRWIGCDLGRWGIHVTRKRMLGIENCKPFEILNLGKYERQYWQGTTFGGAKNQPPTEQTLYEYLAFILKLYGAQPVSGMTHLHGKRGNALIHIGMVDAPVTFDEVNAAVDECVKLKQTELHLLGWEWEMGLQDLVVREAKKKGVKLLLLQIPREVMEQQAVDKGDIQFFELAYLKATVERSQALTAQVRLEDFVIPNSELIPDEVRSKVKQWSDYIDYWAVDWDFQNDTFMQGWVAYRTRKERSLQLASDTHTYEKAGEYRILVKVIDIFGNDTSQVIDAEVN